MTLPIIESILRGELRPNILIISQDPEALEMLFRNARKISQKSQLKEIEYAINDVLKGLVNTDVAYADDKKIRNSAISARANKIIKDNQQFKNIDSEIIIDNVIGLPCLDSPILRFYNTIINGEVQRTRLAMLHLHKTIRDDIYMRSELRALFKKIKNLCRESFEWKEQKEIARLIPIKLTHLYFTLIHTYRDILKSVHTLDYEDNFMDFVYGWKGEYPTSEEEENYNNQIKKRTDINYLDIKDTDKLKNQNSDVIPEEKKYKDKAEIFLESVEKFNFRDIPKIKQLDSEEKIHTLVMTMLENPGHACAMLEFLEFYNWIKTNQEFGFTIGKYETLCSDVIMGIKGRYAFHNVRVSLNLDNKNANKHKAYQYIEQVKKEYDTIYNS